MLYALCSLVHKYQNVHKLHLHSIRNGGASSSDSLLTTDWTTVEMQLSSWDRQGFYSSPTPALPHVPPALISHDPTPLFLTVPKESHFCTQTFLL